MFGTTEPAVRSLSIVVGGLVPPVVYALGKEIDNSRTGLILGSLAVFYPPAILYSQLTRMYSFVILLTPLSFYFLLKTIKRGERKDVGLYVVTTVLLFYTHVLTLAVIGVQVLWTITVLFNRDKSTNYRYWGVAFASLLIPIGAWLPMFFWNLLYFEQPVSGTSGPMQFVQYNSGGVVSLVLVSALAVSLTVARILPVNITQLLVGTQRTQLPQIDFSQLVLLVGWVAVPLIGIVAGFEMWEQVYRTKYGLPSSIGFLTLSGYVLTRYADLRAIVLTVLVLLSYQFQSRWLVPGHPNVLQFVSNVV